MHIYVLFFGGFFEFVTLTRTLFPSFSQRRAPGSDLSHLRSDGSMGQWVDCSVCRHQLHVKSTTDAISQHVGIHSPHWLLASALIWERDCLVIFQNRITCNPG